MDAARCSGVPRAAGSRLEPAAEPSKEVSGSFAMAASPKIVTCDLVVSFSTVRIWKQTRDEPG